VWHHHTLHCPAIALVLALCNAPNWLYTWLALCIVLFFLDTYPEVVAEAKRSELFLARNIYIAQRSQLDSPNNSAGPRTAQHASN